MQRWIGWALLGLAFVGFYLFLRPQEAPVAKRGFALPVGCSLGKTCWVARYSDREPGKGKADYRCGRRAQHGHKGTDFAIADFGTMWRGVPVYAVAEGTVLRTRDSMQDISVQQIGRKAVRGKECGNAVVIDHSGGLTTQYCHMKLGSIAAAPGDKVERGQQIGQLGLSGDTEYPHMHLNVRQDGKRIDPFDGQRLDVACRAEDTAATANASMWEEMPAYQELDLLPLVFSDEPLTRESRWEAPQGAIVRDAPALILTGIAWNVLEGDEWEFTITRPDGKRATNRKITAEHNRQSQWYGNRLFRPDGGFMKGTWTGKLVVTRRKKDGEILRLEKETEVLVTE